MDHNPEFYRIIARDPKGSGMAWAEHIKEFKPLGDGRVLVTDQRGSCYFAELNDIVVDVRVVHKAAGGSICKIMLEG